jgi:hypothetical protein
METLALHLALHGLAVLTLSTAGGLLLYRVILRNTNQAQWHLLHAGGTARGILLVALAGVIDLPRGSQSEIALGAWLMIIFVWTTTMAMLIAAATGRRGLQWHGFAVDRVILVLYIVGGAAVFPACGLLITGLVRALYG